MSGKGAVLASSSSLALAAAALLALSPPLSAIVLLRWWWLVRTGRLCSDRSRGLGLVKTAGCEGGGRRPGGMAAAVPRSRGGTSSNQWAYEPYLDLVPVDGAMNRIDRFDLQ